MRASSSVFVACLVLAGTAAAQTTSQANVSSTGTPSFDAAAMGMSEDGRFVGFESADPNVVPGVSNGIHQVYVHDRATGATETVSVDASGTAGNHSSSFYWISGDGRYVVFDSGATNLVPGIPNAIGQVYVRDRATGTTVCASLDPQGVPADEYCTAGSISADGRFVVFTSPSSNLVIPDVLGQMDVFVRDLASGVITRASVDSGGQEANGWSAGIGISADGSKVLFRSQATNLVPGDTNGVVDCFLRDLRAGTTERVTVATDGSEGNGESDYGVLSPDGRFVLFSSGATNLVPGDTNGKQDAFLRDLQAGTTVRVSLTANGAEATGHTGGGGMSADGRYVVLTSLASDLVPGDVNGYSDTFLLDRQTGGLELVGLAYDGAQANYGSSGGRVSNDGRFVLLYSMSTNLVPGGGDNFGGNFVRDRGPTVEAFCFGDGTGSPCPCGNDGSLGRGCDNSEHTGGARLQSDGRSSLGSDSLVLVTEGMRAHTSCVLIQASLEGDPRAYGDGLLCLAGRPTRLFVTTAAGNVVRVPRTGEPAVSTRSAARGALILPGSSRFYQTYYRDKDASFCPPPAGENWNASNGLAIVWEY